MTHLSSTRHLDLVAMKMPSVVENLKTSVRKFGNSTNYELSKSYSTSIAGSLEILWPLVNSEITSD